MAELEFSDRKYLTWTVIAIFAIVAAVAIFRSGKEKNRVVEANSEILALEAQIMRHTDQTISFQKAKAAYQMDSTNAILRDLLFALYFEAAVFPLYESLGAFPHATAFNTSPNGVWWAVAQGNSFQRFNAVTGTKETKSLPATVWAVALTNAPTTWAAVTADHQIHFAYQGKTGRIALEEKAADYELHFSPGTQYLICLSDETASVYDMEKGERIPMTTTPLAVVGESGAFRWASFDRKDQYAAFCLRQRDVYVVELATGKTDEYTLDRWGDSLAIFPTSGTFAEYVDVAGKPQTSLFLENNLKLDLLEVFVGDGQMAEHSRYVTHSCISIQYPGKLQIPILGRNGEITYKWGAIEAPKPTQRDSVLARLREAADTVYVGLIRSFWEVESRIWEDENQVVLQLEDGLLANWDKKEGKVRHLYTSIANRIQKAAVLPDGGLIAVDELGQVRKWPVHGKLYAEHIPDSLGRHFESPFFKGDQVQFLDLNGTQYTYDLAHGLVEAVGDSAQAFVSNKMTPETESRRKNWLPRTDTSLASIPEYKWLLDHWDLVSSKSLHGGRSEWVVQPSEDHQLLLLGFRLENEDLFHNQFSLVPMSAGEILRTMEAKGL